MLRQTKAIYAWGAVLLISALLVATLVVDATRHSSTGPIKGVAVPRWDAGSLEAPSFRQDLTNIASTGANSVEIVPTWFQDGKTSSTIGPNTKYTLTDEEVGKGIDEAHAKHLSVLLKPHVNVIDNTSRGSIAPSDPTTWEASYTEMIDHYAQIAAAHHVELFAVGTELGGTSANTLMWDRIIDSVRSRYKGKLTYAGLTKELTSINYWNRLDYIGIDAYYPVATIPDSTKESQLSQWKPILESIHQQSDKFGIPVLFTEVGYTARSSTAATPAIPNQSGSVDPAAQATAYAAMLTAVESQKEIAGIYLWMWTTHEPADADGYSPENQPAGEVLKDHWKT